MLLLTNYDTRMHVSALGDGDAEVYLHYREPWYDSQFFSKSAPSITLITNYLPESCKLPVIRSFISPPRGKIGFTPMKELLRAGLAVLNCRMGYPILLKHS